MALVRLHRSDIAVHGIGNEDGFGLRWHQLLFPTDGLAMHLGPVLFGNAIPATEGQARPIFQAPLDESTPPAGQDAAGPATDNATAAIPQVADDANPFGGPNSALFWHPPYFAPAPLADMPGDSTAADAAPPGGFIPKSDAVIWSGPALMVFPGEPHDGGSDSATAGTNGGGDDTAAADPGGTPDGAGPPDIAGTPDLPATPDPAPPPTAVTRADLDPVLSSMGSGNDHAPPPGPDSGDLGAAFLPPDAPDPPHGLDSGFLITPPPPPPPPDFI